MEIGRFIESVNAALGNCIFTINMYADRTTVEWGENTAVFEKTDNFTPMDVATTIRALAEPEVA